MREGSIWVVEGVGSIELARGGPLQTLEIINWWWWGQDPH